MVNISRTFCKAVFLGQKECRYAFYKGKVNSGNSAVCYKKKIPMTVAWDQNLGANNFIFPSVQSTHFPTFPFLFFFLKKQLPD